MSADFTLETVGHGRFAARGSIDAANAAQALAEGRRQLLAVEPVSVDLAALESADGMTLAVLVAWSSHAARAGRTLRFTNIGERLRAVAHLYAVEPFLVAGIGD
ncbi:MAG TPA: STAS domain-containing protein [Dokdonella sp.]|uniref:STAS domain-containing protein n=1 Tax=Dokdonella sp. TaxID=2291710 RepID=UPI0025C7076C|nr:STAS domain-containing protein [Dokdonella sp.]MBX3690747.1 STAS domain-containing protein [Dokdonella sp.]MCW5568207.1 STAS domain-containing protein [Dokdonella sp.]HNR91300.1 STAS domain-containing protein [Dokdonella sp.]